jgi:hypothetical protein
MGHGRMGTGLLSSHPWHKYQNVRRMGHTQGLGGFEDWLGIYPRVRR